MQGARRIDRWVARRGSLVTASAGSATPALTDRAGAPAAPLSPTGRALHDRFTAAIDADLDTPAALRIARQALRAPIPADERRWLALDMDFVLGLDLHESVNVEAGGAVGGSDNAAEMAELPAGAADLLGDRARARAEHDWPAADRLRDALRELGVDPIDRADGTSDWRRLP